MSMQYFLGNVFRDAFFELVVMSSCLISCSTLISTWSLTLVEKDQKLNRNVEYIKKYDGDTDA